MKLDKSTDTRIRAVLKAADSEGRLGSVAAGTGIAGGVAELRRMMRSSEELSIIDRGMLGLPLGVV